MPFRYRKSVKVAGIRFNFTQRGLTSASSGSRWFRVNVSKRGTKMSAGIPGSGLRYEKQLSNGKRIQSQQSTFTGLSPQEQRAVALANEGIAAAKIGDRIQATPLLKQALQLDPTHVVAWIYLSGSVDTPAERRHCFERILELSPQSDFALKGLRGLAGVSAQDPLAGFPPLEQPSHITDADTSVQPSTFTQPPILLILILVAGVIALFMIAW